jgi:hypothetical protein
MQILIVLRGGTVIHKKMKSLLITKMIKFVLKMYTKRITMNS